MRVLITGAAGFAGSHLIEFLLRKSSERYAWGGDAIEIFGADRWRVKRENIAHLESAFHYREFDMTDRGSVLGLIREARPDRIFHLAAQSFVPTSWQAPQDTITTNIIGELNLLEAVRECAIEPAIQIACSSEEYGFVAPEETPITEENPLRPLSPYAVSKVAQDLLGYQYHRSYGMKIIRTRAFNHSGPRRGEQFATSAFAKQIAEIEAGRRDPVIRHGNLAARRDISDVRDVVRAYWLATEKGEPGEAYNVCSEIHWSMAEVLDFLLSISKARALSVEEDPALMRPSDVPLLFGSAAKFRTRTGWAPEIDLKRTLTDLLDYWRGVVS
jgi:GDP-4-dehydro-6-deoxy-D-mannose reductase